MRLIPLQSIRAEKIARSRSWILGEMKAGRFPQPKVRGNPNLWDACEIDAWLIDFVAKAASRNANGARVPSGARNAR